uniref:Bm1189 n=1 Tax=Brugia malayi TaxID=6279 RepID=A0A1I9G0E5_BRUMA|nr:Bm1189 [Brugia malayi]
MKVTRHVPTTFMNTTNSLCIYLRDLSSEAYGISRSITTWPS